MAHSIHSVSLIKDVGVCAPFVNSDEMLQIDTCAVSLLQRRRVLTTCVATNPVS